MTETTHQNDDALKLQILEDIGEDVNTVGKVQSILVTDPNVKGIKPIRMNLSYVQSKDKFDDPMRIMLVMLLILKRHPVMALSYGIQLMIID